MTKRQEIIELHRRFPELTYVQIASKIGCHKCTVTRTLSKSTDKYQRIYREVVRKSKRQKLKKILVDYKGGSCSKCGYSKCLDALDFHHIDPKTKSFGVSSHLINDIDKLKREADKCILVCANCHREIHAK